MLLQAAQRRALDVINSIGLSDSLLRVIDRRQRMDRWIVYGGMVRVVLPSCDSAECDKSMPVVGSPRSMVGLYCT